METMTALQLLNGILFAILVIINIYKAVEDGEEANVNAAMGWLCALLWVFISV